MEPLRFTANDLLSYTIEDIVCTNCIEGFCPARTPSICEGAEFTLCGAKGVSAEVLNAYAERTGIVVEIERP